MKQLKPIDCRSKIGIAISLIDTISLLCNQLGKMGEKVLSSKSVKEAIRDLQGDETASYALNKLSKTKEDEANAAMIHSIVNNLTPAQKMEISRMINEMV